LAQDEVLSLALVCVPRFPHDTSPQLIWPAPPRGQGWQGARSPMRLDSAIEVIETSNVVLGGRFYLPERREAIYDSLTSVIVPGVERRSRLRVGVKVVLKSSFTSDTERQNALAEVEIHKSVPRHQNVIELLASEETAEALLLVTPYAPGGDLWGLVKYGRTYCEREVRHCAGQMLAALRHVHDVCGLVHHDIKPHNFLVFHTCGKITVKLCDFGLAERTQRPTPDGLAFRGLKGTHGWFAPELLKGLDYDQSVDLFASGLILFRMLGGYAAWDPPSDMREPAAFDERYWLHITADCRDFVGRLLSLDPGGRGTAGAHAAHPWLAGAAPPEPTPEKLKALSVYGPPPVTDVCFWPVGEIPEDAHAYSYVTEETSPLEPSNLPADETVTSPMSITLMFDEEE